MCFDSGTSRRRWDQAATPVSFPTHLAVEEVRLWVVGPQKCPSAWTPAAYHVDAGMTRARRARSAPVIVVISKCEHMPGADMLWMADARRGDPFTAHSLLDADPPLAPS